MIDITLSDNIYTVDYPRIEVDTQDHRPWFKEFFGRDPDEEDLHLGLGNIRAVVEVAR